MLKYTIYHGQYPSGEWKIGATYKYPKRCKQQKLTNYYILEEHDCRVTAGIRELELQKQYGYKQDTKTYDETLKQTSDKIKGRTLSDNHKDKISSSLTGYVKSDEHRKNLSKSLMGKVATEQTRIKMSKSFTGRKLNNETKKRMSEAKKGSNGPTAILNEDIVLYIRAQYKRYKDTFGDRISAKRIGKVFGVSESTIISLLSRRTWKHI